MKSYTELCTLPTYEERLEYLQLHGEVGRDTFGFDRWLNQDFYQSREWRQFRDRIIARDMGCDLGCPDHPITDWVLRDGRPVRPRISIHHLNPITKDDVLRHSENCWTRRRPSAFPGLQHIRAYPLRHRGRAEDTGWQ